MKLNPRYIKLSAAVVASLISACTIEVETPTDDNGVPSYTNKLSELYEIECNAETATLLSVPLSMPATARLTKPSRLVDKTGSPRT